MRIEFDPNVPADLLPILLPLLNRYRWLAPLWCQQLLVRYEGSADGGESASMAASKPYRWAVIRIKGNFLSSSERERRDIIIHEYLHIPTVPAIDYAESTFKLLFNDGNAPKFEKHVLSQLTDYYEAGIQDLAERILSFEEDVRGPVAPPNPVGI